MIHWREYKFHDGKSINDHMLAQNGHTAHERAKQLIAARDAGNSDLGHIDFGSIDQVMPILEKLALEQLLDD